MTASRGELLGLTADELGALMVDWGEKPYHGRQLYGALYRRRQLDTGSMTDLSKSLRRKLASCTITLPRLKKRQRAGDGTDKYLLELTDGEKIECVLIPERKRNYPVYLDSGGLPTGLPLLSDGHAGVQAQPQPGGDPGADPLRAC